MLRSLGLIALLTASFGAHAEVTADRLVDAASEPHNWLTYSGTYASQRHTSLRQIRASNVAELELKWIFQAQSLESFETTPLVVDGVMYITEAPNTALALDAASGRVFWRYQYDPFAGLSALLWAGQPRARDSRQYAFHGDARRAAHCDRRDDRTRHLANGGGRSGARVCDDARAARRQG
jgi:glucose dehydrogenase